MAQEKKYRQLKESCNHEPIVPNTALDEKNAVFCGICRKHMGFACEDAGHTYCELDEDEICIHCGVDYYDHE